MDMDTGGVNSYITIYNGNSLPGELFGNIDFAPIYNEMVTNGTFTTDTDGWSISNPGVLSIDTNRLKVLATAGTCYGFQNITVEIGKSYTVKGTLTEGAGVSTFRAGSTQLGTDLFNSGWTVYGSFEFEVVATTTTLCLAAGAADYVFFDDVSVKENEAVSGDMSPDLAADIVDSGDFEETLGSDLVDSGDFTPVLGSDEITSGDFDEVLGSELLTNPDFEIGDPPTGWSPGADTTLDQVGGGQSGNCISVYGTHRH